MNKIIALLFFFVVVSCASSPEREQRIRDRVVKVLNKVGDPAIRMFGVTVLNEYAPELVQLIDQPTPDGVITLAEATAFANTASIDDALLLLAAVAQH